MNTLCIIVQKCLPPEKVGGQDTASPQLQIVGEMSPCPPTDYVHDVNYGLGSSNLDSRTSARLHTWQNARS